MTDYDHDKAKVLYPAGAAEVERLRAWLRDAMPDAMKEFDGYVPPEDGAAGEYYVEGWNDCRDAILEKLKDEF